MIPEVQALYDQALKLFDDNEYEKVILLLSDEVLNKYKSAELYTMKSRASNGEKKLNYAEKAISINNKYSDAYLAKGTYLSDNEKYEEAIKEFDTAILLDPNNFRAYNNRGLVKHSLKEYREAVENYTKSIELRKEGYWRPFRNRSRAYQELASIEKDNDNFESALEYIKLAIQDIDESLKDKKTNKDGLESQKKNLKEQKKLINDAKNSHATIMQVNEMKKEVESAKKAIDNQAKETQATLDNVQQLRDRMKEQADQFEMLTKNVRNFEDKFKSEQLELKALESFFEDTLKGFNTKVEEAEENIASKNLALKWISVFCIVLIVIAISQEKEIIKDISMMIYMISLTAIVLTPFIWMLKLAIKKRNELFLLETDYRNKTALASSLYSFKLTLGDMYTKETTQQAFSTIYGQNPVELISDDKSIRMKNKKEQDYPHITLEIVQKVLPDIVEKCVKAVLDKKEDKKENKKEGSQL